MSSSIINITGSLSAVNTTYGSPSGTPGSLIISGSNLIDNITVTAPAGYELSTSLGTGYSSTLTLSQSNGIVANSSVYVRLKASASVAGSPYSGNIICSSAGISNLNIATVSSIVSPQKLTITANNVTKTYGNALTGGTGSTSFTSNGLQNGETIGSVNIAYGSGSAASASVGTYLGSVTASAASGGSFSSGNYTINYNTGNITVSTATLNITANPQTKIYGGSDPSLTYTVTGFTNGENVSLLTGSLTRIAGENAGVYPITLGNLTASTNYTIQYSGNNLTITPASQQITWSQTLSTGCNGETQIILTASSSSGLPVLYTVSNNNIATVTGNVLTLVNSGITAVIASQSGSNNYLAATSVPDTLNYKSATLANEHWNDAIIFDNSSNNYVAWQWYKNGSMVPGSTAQYYNENNNPLNGQYYVIATDKNTVSVQTCPITLTPIVASGGGITVFPNPVLAGSTFKIVSNYTDTQLQGSTLSIISIGGVLQSQLTAVHPTVTMNAPSVGGIYIITLTWPNGQKASTNLLVK